MADNTTLNLMSGGDVIATDDVSGVKYQRMKLVDGTLDSTAAIAGDATYGLDVDVTRLPAEGFISTNNSSTAALGISGVFTGTSDEITNYSSVTVYVFADVASATDGLSIQQSSNGTNWDVTDVYTIPASTGKTFGVQCTARYLRVVYTNGGTGQAIFRLQTILHINEQRTASVRPQDARSNENDFGEVVAYIAGYNGTTWDRLRSDTTNGLDVDVTRLPALVAGTENIGDVDVASIAAGDNNIGNVDIVTMPNVTLAAGTNTNEVVGDVAQDQPIAGNPVAVGWRASTAVPSAMSGDGDVVYPWANRSGAPVVTQAPHVGLNSDPWNLVHEAAQYTSTQTSTVLVTGGASEKIVVTQIQIQAFATTTFDLQVYFGTGAFSRGTSRAVFDGTFKPSSTSAPGVVMQGPFIAGTNGDDLMVTTSAAGSVTINVWYYVVT